MPQKKLGVHYQITSTDLAAHLFHVTLTVEVQENSEQIFSLPVWIPGSYMVREFARNVVQIHAHCDGKKIALRKCNKSTWKTAACCGKLVLEYTIYAWDLSVRTAHLDQNHGFFNGSSVFLQVQGREALPHIVDIVRPNVGACKTWRIATSLSILKAKQYGFGTYIAKNYDELIDHPVEMGDFQMVGFKAHGVPHDFVLTGQVPNVDMARIARDLQKICEEEIAFFEPRTKRAPMDRYVFMTMAVGDGYGGLEHRASTALICNRNDLPTKNDANTSEAYRSFLGLCSHEYFHTWNVKRIKPAAFKDYDFSQENYTQLLWLFEGFTSYYDDLIVRRCGLMDESNYLKLVAKTVNAVQRGSGRKKQSLAESSFDAWTKYYRQDENSPNAIVSYYAKGSLVGLALDLTIRKDTQGKKSLDDVMRALWKKFGKDFYSRAEKTKQQGLGEDEFASIVADATGVNIKRFLSQYVHGTDDLPLAKLFADFAVELSSAKTPNALKASFNVRTSRNGSDCKLAHVYEGGAAHRAGLSAGDVIVAINGLRVTANDVSNDLAQMLSPYSAGEEVVVHAFRRDELMQVAVKLQTDDAPNLGFKFVSNANLPLAGKRPSY